MSLAKSNIGKKKRKSGLSGLGLPAGTGNTFSAEIEINDREGFGGQEISKKHQKD